MNMTMAAPDPVRMVDFYAQKLQDIKQQITDLNQEKTFIERELINLVGAQEEGSTAHETSFFKVTTTGKIDRKVITKHLGTVKEVVTPEIFNSIFRLKFEVNVTALKHLKKQFPKEYNAVAYAIESKPAKTSVKVDALEE
ncbi:DUF7173 family protein [Zooshikella harenae]|uniref:DUF2312 domain-containing protein n=1 Tax=Zooshikella harenae TaxID=2827238 RepID=A0ABS5ZI97_9GAMM|nr:hypothetical protein [Zooshikella harenae]MBU2713799.1 hypothetical protein [Zooshikella harenae]